MIEMRICRLIRLARAAFLMISVVLLPLPALADHFGVTPMGVELNRHAKSGALTITNEGDAKNTIQLQVYEWTHDSAGKDIYTDTKDIIYYPKIFSVEARGQQVVRLGFKGVFPQKEKTYRIIIQEIPNPSSEERKGKIAVSIQLRFAVPIFVSPVVQKVETTVGDLGLSRGVLRAVLKNTGNVHVKFSTIRLRGFAPAGQEVYAVETAGWYVLSGRERSYEFTIPRDACNKMSRAEVEAVAQDVTARGSLEVLPAMCKP